MKKWQKNFLIHSMAGLLAYIVAVSASVVLLSSGREKTVIEQVGLALMPVLPFGFMVWAIIKNVRFLDEMQRRIHLEAVLVATLVTGFISFSYGFLEVSELVPYAPSLVWAPLTIGMWGIANAIIARQYDGGNDE